jgi:hypothetical protein
MGVEELEQLGIDVGARHDVEQRDRMPFTGSATACDEATQDVPVEVDLDELHVHTDHLCREREAVGFLEGLPERLELLAVAMGVDGHLLDERVDHIRHRTERRSPVRTR